MIGMHVFDWVVVGWVMVVVFGVAFYFRERASTSFDEFFLSGRSLPWWLLGMSMVATSFASDTPLAVTEIIAKSGIAGNWEWWVFLTGTTLTVYFFAGPWRRAGITTDVELAAMRYGGASGQFLRGFRAFYMAFVFSAVILAWVIQAMAKVLTIALELDPAVEYAGLNAQTWMIVALCVVALVYTLLSGLWGVVATDFLQFVIAYGGSIVLAVLAWDRLGGAAGVPASIDATLGAGRSSQVLAFLPSSASDWAGFGAGVFVYFLFVQWWAVVYPGAEPGGGSYVAQRMLAARTPADARAGTLLYTVVHFAIRPWPWIIVALFAVVHFGADGDARGLYPRAMLELLPPGLFGLLLASFFAAFMSTVDTHLTLAGSYIVNDLYRPFLARGRSDRHYLAASRVAVILVLVTSGLISHRLEMLEHGVRDAWRILIALGAGSGLVLILRWYWWRVNAVSEITAMLVSFVSAFLFDPQVREVFGDPAFLSRIPTIADRVSCLMSIISLTTLAWLVATLVTRPVARPRLTAFYRQVRPGGAWGPVAADCPDVEPASSIGHDGVGWLLATVLVFALLFAVGKWLFGDTTAALALGGVTLIAALLLWGNDLEDSGPDSG